MKTVAGLLLLCPLFTMASRSAEIPRETAPIILKTDTDGRREVTLDLRNPSVAAGQFKVEAGTIYQGSEGSRLITLREAVAPLPAHGTVELAIPAAALNSAAVGAKTQSAQSTPDAEPKLAPLLDYLKTRNDVPRGTSQCAAFVLLQDLSFAQWLQYLAAARPANEAGADKVTDDALVTALDAVAIVRTIAPTQTFRLSSDPELKLRALRQPGLRAKALQIFGMSIPGDPPIAGGVAPDLGQLIHTKPGDNCPICRMRAQMERPANDL